MTEKTCCQTGEWVELEWTSECRDWYMEIALVSGDEFTITLNGDQWEFKDTFYGTEDEAKRYAYDVMFGVSPNDGIASAVAGAKANRK